MPVSYRERNDVNNALWNQSVRRQNQMDNILSRKGAGFQRGFLIANNPKSIRKSIGFAGEGFKFKASCGGKGYSTFPTSMTHYGGAAFPTAFARPGTNPRGRYNTSHSGAKYQTHLFRGIPGRIYYPN